MNMEYSSYVQPSFRLNLQMVADWLDEHHWHHQLHRPDDPPTLTRCLLYYGQTDLQKDSLYVIPEGAEQDFPADSFSYITTTSLQGDAPHIRGVMCSFPELLNAAMAVFSHYTDFERELSNTISSGGTLSQLCCVASRYFANPVYVHDNMFCVLGQSAGLDGHFEFSEKNKRPHIPLWLINEYKFDEAYRDSLSAQQASIWKNDLADTHTRSLYVNLREGSTYLGRLLIDEKDTAIRPGQFRAAEFFGSYVLLWLKNQALSNQQMHYSYEHLFIDLLENGETDEQELRTILGILNWKPEDRYLCLKLQEQNSGDLVHPDLAVNSRLSSLLSHHVSFQYQHKLFVILNLSVSGLDLGELRQRLAPLIRDSCLYVGISNPIDGINSLRLGFIQADIALEYITGTDSSDWMVLFASCALNYIRQSACKQLPARMVAHPLLLDLMEYDRAQGTQYYNTLRVYLLCERNIPATAAALIIHRTTLTYRLGKILELTHLNLDNANLRMYLLLSFQLLDQDGSRDFIRN